MTRAIIGVVPVSECHALQDVSTPARPSDADASGGEATAEPASRGRAAHEAHDAWLLRFGDPLVESVATLRLAVPAARELAVLGEALGRSAVGDSARDAFAMLDAAAALAFDGHDVDARAVLGDPEGRDAGVARRHVEARGESLRRERGRDPDVGSMLALATALAGAPAELREREPSVHERASLVPGQRLPRGRDRIERALRAWLDLLVRSAGEAEPLVVVGEAYRRLLALRPFARGNLGLAQATTALLLELEGTTSGWTLPLAHRLVARRERHARLLVRGEREPDAWLAFWLESVRACAAESRAALLAWERHRERVAGIVAEAVRAPLSDAALDALSRPGFTTAMLVDGTGLTRHGARLAVDALEASGRVQGVGAGRARHHVARDLLDALIG